MSGHDVHVQADSLLRNIFELHGELNRISRMRADALKEVDRKYQARIQELKERLNDQEKRLRLLARENRQKLFQDNPDRLDLKHGTLLYIRFKRVIRARSITPESLEKQGLAQGVRVIKKVNWPVVETWPDALLQKIGTRREVKEVFEYELS